MIRFYLTEVTRARLARNLSTIGVYQTDNLMLFIEASIWRIRTGLPWRDLPRAFGPWKTIYNRFNSWCASGLWDQIYKILIRDADLEWVFVDGSYVKVHQHASGSREPAASKSIGLSRGGTTTKIHMASDAHGNPVRFFITAGNVHDSPMLGNFRETISQSQAVVCDKGYDSQSNRDLIVSLGSEPHIPLRNGAKRSNASFDCELYRHRHLVENLFARIKHFRAVATRFDKLTRNYHSVVAIACALIWLKL